MKFIRVALFLFLSASFLLACKKEKSFENGNNTSFNSEWEFKQSKQYHGKVDTAYIEDAGVGIKALFLEGTSSDGKELLAIQILGIDITKPATYKSPAVLFTYLNSSGLIYANDVQSANDFTLVVTHIDSASISATFSGSVKDSSGAVKAVTDGKFKAKLKSTNVPPPSNSGNATFWAKSGCTAGGNIIVKLSNSQTGTITSFTTVAPSCGVSGAANFTLPAGNYSWKAYCGSSDSTSGTITVFASQCTKTEVSFAPLSNNCKISSIGFYYMPGATLDGAFNAFYNGTQVNDLQVYDSSSSSLYNDFPVTYSTNKIKFGNDQTFTLNGNGTVSQYNGFLVPYDNSTDSVIVKYEYDANGYMSKRSLYLNAYPTTPVLITAYTWSSGNLTRIVNTIDLSNERWETDLEYDLTKTPKTFVNLMFLSYEILQFQQVINVGKNSANLPVKATTKYYESNTLKQTDVSNFVNYVIDANNYVKSFEITGADYDSYLYWTQEKYVLNYKCF